MDRYTLAQWAILQGLTFEEVYEPNISYIYVDECGTVYKEMADTGELIQLD